MSSSSSANNSVVMVQGSGGGAWRRGLYSSPSSSGPYHPSGSNMQHGHGVNVSATTVPFQSDCLHAVSAAQSQPAQPGNSRRLRLFGVNLECQLDEAEPSTPDGSSLSSLQGPVHQQFYSQPAYSSNSTHSQMVPKNLSHKKAAGENEDLDFYQDCGDIIQAKIRQVIGFTVLGSTSSSPPSTSAKENRTP
ncbi:hypothetical protein D5086_029234 [Populus alba]|uniref:Uncharacterized protein n=1 Tax=Populus alba TaxID=43335 RepID=A0ACC4ATL9_POPAL